MKDLVICEICGKTFSSTQDVCPSCRARMTSPSTKKIVRVSGYKALTGTPKQKAWGESIRATFIEDAQDIESVKALIISASLQKAKFWIDSRNNENLESELIEVSNLTAKANAGDMTGMERREELINKLF